MLVSVLSQELHCLTGSLLRLDQRKHLLFPPCGYKVRFDNVPTDIPYLFFYLNNKISIFRKSTCPKNTCFCVLPLFKYTCENLSLLRETVLLSSVCKYRLSASTLRSKRGDRFTSVPLCNYSSLAGSDLIYQGRSTCGSILSRIILKNSHQLNFTAEKTIRT